MLPEYEVYALRYATREAQRRDHFIGGDPHDGPMPMDYYTWLVTGPAGAYVIDTGFTAEMAKERKRTFLRCPAESLSLLGVDPGSVRDVILTHMHYDHVGNFHKFPNARFHLQEREMAYATGHRRAPRRRTDWAGAQIWRGTGQLKHNPAHFACAFPNAARDGFGAVDNQPPRPDPTISPEPRLAY